MPGMHSGLGQNNHTVVAAFDSALVRQGLLALAIVLVVAVAWNVLRSMQLRRALAGSSPADGAEAAWPEPAARRLLRIAFGLIWIFDGVLQGQSSMPLGMPSQVIHGAAAGSPHWVIDVVNFGSKLWDFHPVAAAAAAVWIQIGIGLWLLAAPRGRWSRAAGLAALGWGLVVWIFGEAFGSIFVPGLTWLFGAPGAVLFYCLAGLAVALPDRAWTGRRAGVVLVRTMGAFFVGMAVLQAWPGRGFWQGGSQGTLAGMVGQMAQTPQPHFLSSWVAAFGSFDVAHGWAVNLVAVVTLAAIGAAFLSARPDLVRIGLAAAVVVGLADWVLIEDLGFLGGVGTDPNSMLPMLLVMGAGFLALVRPAGAVPAPGLPRPGGRLVERMTRNPTYTFRGVAAAGALGIVLLGAVPMAAAATNGTADPILSEAINGSPGATDSPTPGFTLINENGRTVSLHGLQGKVLAITFLDPVCTSDCPLIAQEFHDADLMLGAQGRHVELLAIDANPLDTATAFLQAFDAQEHLTHVPNWQYLTGTPSALERVWDDFGVQVAVSPGGAMVAHSELAYVIDAGGRTRYVLDADPGPGTAATQSSFAATLAQAIETTLHDT